MPQMPAMSSRRSGDALVPCLLLLLHGGTDLDTMPTPVRRVPAVTPTIVSGESPYAARQPLDEGILISTPHDNSDFAIGDVATKSAQQIVLGHDLTVAHGQDYIAELERARSLIPDRRRHESLPVESPFASASSEGQPARPARQLRS